MQIPLDTSVAKPQYTHMAMTVKPSRAVRDWMRHIGAMGGRKKSAAKAAACRANAKRPRPNRRKRPEAA